MDIDKSNNDSLNLKLELENEELTVLEETKKAYNILNSYINSNLSFKKDSKSNLEELQKLSLFYDDYSNTKVLESLLRNNTILSNIIRSVITSNFYSIKANKFNDIIDNNFILLLIDFYQALYPKTIETIDLFYRVYYRDKEARNKLILDNKGIVYDIVFKYATNDIDTEDLISEGMIGLIKAIDNFKLSENVEFSTYAFTCIEGAIKRFINTKEGDIKVNVSEKLLIYNKKTKLLEEMLGREPNFDEVAKELQMNKSEIYMFNSLKSKFIRLNSFIIDDGENTAEIGDLIPADPEQFIDSDVNNEKEFFNRLLYSSNLTINQICILIYRFGLENYEEHKLEIIGQKFGITDECVRKYEGAAIKKIRNSYKSVNPNCSLSQDNLQFILNRYSTRKVFSISKNKIINNIPIPMLNMIVKNIIYYNLYNNSYLLEKIKQKNSSSVNFCEINTKMLNIISLFILEYDKIQIYDSLMDLNFDELKIFELNYDESTNPKHLFINESFNEIEKKKFLELFNRVIENLQKSTLIVDNIYNYFNDSTIDQIDEVLEELTEGEKNLLHLRFGEDLKNNAIYPLTKISCISLPGA